MKFLNLIQLIFICYISNKNVVFAAVEVIHPRNTTGNAANGHSYTPSRVVHKKQRRIRNKKNLESKLVE